MSISLSQLRSLTSDERLLFATRTVRLLAYGFLSVVLVLYLAQVGLSEAQIGLLLTLTLVGDTLISLWITTSADLVGRQRMLLLSAGLMLFASLLFAVTGNYIALIFAATVGVISPSGGEVGPFLAIEQAALAQTVASKNRTSVFAWYNLVGSFATALGALMGGVVVQGLQGMHVSPLGSYRTVIVGCALLGIVLGWMFLRLSPATESEHLGSDKPKTNEFFGLHRSHDRSVDQQPGAAQCALLSGGRVEDYLRSGALSHVPKCETAGRARIDTSQWAAYLISTSGSILSNNSFANE